jgi:hypothetical protein
MASTLDLQFICIIKQSYSIVPKYDDKITKISGITSKSGRNDAKQLNIRVITDFPQKLNTEIPAFLHFLQHRQLSTEKESRIWFNPTSLHTEALQKIIRSNRNRLEIEMHELVLDIMDSTGTDTFSFCYNDLLLLLIHSQVKVEKHQVRKVLQECWKLTPAPNTLTYSTYQVDYTRECRYSPIRRIGRFYTITREQLAAL